MDRIEIRGLTVLTVVGVLPHERETAQPDVVQRIAATVSESKDHLLERLAERICEAALTTSRVEAVDVALRKVRPPISKCRRSSTRTHSCAGAASSNARRSASLSSTGGRERWTSTSTLSTSTTTSPEQPDSRSQSAPHCSSWRRG
jgi:dihydroneopterin aldolase/2-amino-4-hydroxy-6-hydroxymethyldihydropteridine diphosphokinase